MPHPIAGRFDLLRLLWQVFGRKTRFLWGAACVLGFTQVMLDFALIALLALLLADRLSIGILAPLVILGVRIAVSVATLSVNSHLSGMARAELQVLLWGATMSPRGYPAVTLDPAAHNRVLNQAPTDVSAGVVLPTANIISDGGALVVVCVVLMLNRPLETSLVVLCVAIVLAFSGVVVIKGTGPVSRMEAATLETAHHLSWDLTNGVRDLMINQASAAAMLRARAVGRDLADVTRKVLQWALGQRTLLDAMTMALLVAVAWFGGTGQGAFVGAAFLLRTLPLVSRLGANSAVAWNVLQRVSLWSGTLGLAARQRKDEEGGRGAPAEQSTWSDREDLLDLELRPCRRIRSAVSIHLMEGEWLQLSGPSGAGKSSILDAVAGLWDGFEGSVSVEVPPSGMAYATQSPFLMSGSVASNVVLEREFDDEALLVAAEIAGLPETFGPLWAERSLRDRGSDISGGQRQRISLARALVARPSLLLLDEATANLDTDSEESILREIRAKFPRLAVVMVTHRPPRIDWKIGSVVI